MKYILGFVGVIIVTIGITYLFGWIEVHQTKTIFKAKENAKREVFEQTQSYVEGKKQEALKYYKEYKNSDQKGKNAICNMVSNSFANFDENKLREPLYSFVYNCKY